MDRELAASAVAARLVSATLNYTVNRGAVFRGGARIPHRQAAPRYVALALTSLTANVLLLQLLATATGSLVVSKVVTEFGLFLAGFALQRAYVFAHPRLNRNPAASGRHPEVRSLVS